MGKKKALQNEQSLLLSIMNDIEEMGIFLKNIILIENLFVKDYAPYKQKQKAARAKYAKNIAKFEKVEKKPHSEASSFVELMFGSTTHISSFQEWLNKIVYQCKKENVNIVSFSGAKTKKIARAFYKAFYVYVEKNGFKQMTDVLRCSFVFDDFDNLYRCYSIIELLAEQSVGGILRVKDRFHPQHIPFGYRDMLINVVCPGSKIVTEIQLHFEPLSKYKKISHSMYKKARLFERETENLAYKYSTQYLRPKIGSNAFYQPSKDDMIDDDDQENETKAVKSFDVLLKEWGLEKYIDKMRDEGWDDPEDWKDITDDELKNDIGFSKGHIKKWHRNFDEWTKQKKEEEQKEAVAIFQQQIYGNNQLKMQLKAAQDAEDKERRRIMQQEQDKIDAMRKEMEREKKAFELERQQKKKEDEERRRKIKKEAEELEHKKKRLEQQRKEREAKAKKEEARRKKKKKKKKKKELEEEKEAEMERQRKKNNHEWDINCKGNAVKVNGQ